MTGPRRSGMALPAVLLLVFIGLAIALGIHHFSTETYRRTSRGTYATMSEVLAESAEEEAWYTLQRDVNTAGTQLYKLFRSGDSFENFSVNLPVLTGKLNDPQFGGYVTDRYDASSFAATVSVQWGNPYGNKMKGMGSNGEFDPRVPHERMGMVTIRGSAQAKTRNEGLANFRRMVVKRPFRMTLCTPPMPFDRSGLVILSPEYVTDVPVAGELDAKTLWAVQGAGKPQLEPLLNQSNSLLQSAADKAKQFNDGYKDAASPPFGDHLTPPPQWLQDIIDKMGGLVSASTKLDVQGQGRRPFLFKDEVMVARTTMAGGALGKLGDFNYRKNIKDKLKPLNDLMGALQHLADLTTGIITTLKDVHRSVPYGVKLDAMVAPLYAFVPEIVPSIKDCCEGLHEKIMDPVLELALGIGQVIAIAQKIVIEVPMMGQQAFAGFQNQIQNAASGAVNGAIGQINIADPNLTGLPTNTPAMGLALNMPLPNYAIGDDIAQTAGMNPGQLVSDAGEAVLQLIISMVEKELVSFITEQMAAIAAQIITATTVTAAACAGPQAIVTCIPAKAALALAFQAITKTILKQIENNLNRIASFKGKAAGGIVAVLTQQVPVFKSNPILQDLHLDTLLGNLLQAAWEKRDISQDVNDWMNQLATTFATRLQDAASGTGIDKLGGVLKGYALRHRFRNLVEFDGSSGQGGGLGGSSEADGSGDGSGTDGLNAWRGAFDQAFSQQVVWQEKATWNVHNKDEWGALIARYFDGKWQQKTPGHGVDGSGDGDSAHWQEDSYKPSKGYGLSGVIYYSGTDDLQIDFTGEHAFIGKAILYVEKASITVNGCKMRDNTKDSFTLITKKPVTLPPTDVEIAVCAIGDGEDCKVAMSDSTKILGALVLKRYRVQDEDDPKASLNGELTYNDRLNAAGGDAVNGLKESHLFIAVSPYVMSREMETQP